MWMWCLSRWDDFNATESSITYKGSSWSQNCRAPDYSRWISHALSPCSIGSSYSKDSACHVAQAGLFGCAVYASEGTTMILVFLRPQPAIRVQKNEHGSPRESCPQQSSLVILNVRYNFERQDQPDAPKANCAESYTYDTALHVLKEPSVQAPEVTIRRQPPGGITNQP